MEDIGLYVNGSIIVEVTNIFDVAEKNVVMMKKYYMYGTC